MATKKSLNTEDGKIVDLRFVTVRVGIKGSKPILLHNGQLTDPLNDVVLRIKEITGKKKGARDGQASEEAKARLEFEGGLYLNPDGDVCIPGENIAACIKQGATMRKKGEAIKRCVRIYDEWRLIYEGMERHDGLTCEAKQQALLATYEDFSYRKRIVNSGIGRGSIMRTRPMFKRWSLGFEMTVTLGADIDHSDVKSALEVAGMLYGLGDWHGRFGLFEVVKYEVVK